MKKHLFLKTLLVLIGILIGSVSTQMWAGTKKVYVDIQGFTGYSESGKNIEVHYWGGSSDDYAIATATSFSYLYCADVPDDATNLQVVRADANNRSNRYNWQNETSDTSHNIYHVTGWDKSGTWEHKDVFPKQKYIYFNVSGSNTWTQANFNTKFCWSSIHGASSSDTWCKSKLSDGVYYTQVPNTDHLGKVKLCRMNPGNDGDQWNYSNDAQADNAYNCLYVHSDYANWWDTWDPRWTTYAPPLSAVSLSDNGTAILAGGGTKGNPYLIATGATIKVVASGTKAVADNDATIWYNIKDYTTSKQNSSTAACSFTASATANTVYKMNVDGYTKVSSTSSSTLGSDTIYYKTVSVKDISVYIYVGGCSAAEINSIELFGTPYVGSVALDAVHYYIGAFTTDGNWRKYTFTNVSEVRNLVVARSGGRAVDNITATADVYAKWDGTPLDGKCVSAPSLTWTTTPTGGTAGGSMTAVVNTSAVSGGSPSIIWTSSDDDVATVSNGVITYVAAGTATITAAVSWSATGDYCAGSQNLAQAITVSAAIVPTISAASFTNNPILTWEWVKLSFTYANIPAGAYYRIKGGAGYYRDKNNLANIPISGDGTENFEAACDQVNMIDNQSWVVEIYNSSNEKIVERTVGNLRVTSQAAELSSITLSPNTTQNYAGSPIDITMSVTSKYLPNPVVIFYVADNSNSTTYEVVATTGAIGSRTNYSTTHTATFSASHAATYSVTAKVFAGLLLANWDGKDFSGGGGWYNNNGGHAKVANPAIQANNASATVQSFTKGTNWWDVPLYWLTTTNADKTGYNYRYIHTRQYSAQSGKPKLKVSNYKGDLTTGDSFSANQWCKLTYDNYRDGSERVDFFMPLFENGNTTVYIDDIILSTEASMSARATQSTAASVTVRDVYNITYKDQGNVAFSGSHVDTPSAHPTTHTYGTATPLNSATKTGYTFGGWFTTSACTGVAVNSLGATAYSDDITLYAKWTEVMSSLSTDCHYDVGTPGYAAPTVSGSADDVGYSTTRTITATAAGTGYTFVGWTLTNCTRTDGGVATANPITIRSNGDGAAATVVANYEEDLTTGWTICGGSIFGGTDWAQRLALTKKSGHSTESVGYYTVSISATNADGGSANYNFKVQDPSDHWFGLHTDNCAWDWLYKRDYGTQTMINHSTNNDNVRICADIAGNYEIKVDYSTPASPTVTITFPTTYTLTYSIGDVNGTSGTISTSPTTESGSLVLSGNTVTLTGPAAKTGYTWKGWYTNAAGTEGKIADTDRAITVTMDADKTLYACYSETMHDVTVNAETGGTVSYNGGAAGSSCTARAGIATASANIVATASAGYYFIGWSLPDGTITKASESAYNGATSTCTINATADSKTVTALFGVRYALLGSRDDAPTDTPAGMPGWGEGNEAPFTYSAGTYTKTVDLTVPNEMYKFRIVDRRGASHTSYGLSSKAVVAADGSYHDLASTNADAQLATAGVGTYTLYVQTNGSGKPRVKIVNPLSHLITMGTMTDYGTGGSITAVDGEATPNPISNGKYIKDGGSIVVTASKNTGYTFAGWFSDAQCTIELDDDDDAVELTYTKTGLNGAKSIYAKFTENRTTVNLSASPAGKGTFTCGGDAVTSVPAGVTTHPAVTAVPATGYRVNTSATVWSKDNNYVTLSSTTANPVTITGTGTIGNSTALTATFTPKTYTITLNQNGATTESDPTSLTATYDGKANGASDVFTLTNPERTGYTFNGWFESAGGTGAEIITTAKYYKWEDNPYVTTTGLWQHDGDVTVYAKWTPNNYTVSFDVNGGTASTPDSKEVTFGSAYGTLPSGMTHASKQFIGWYDDADEGEGNHITAETIVSTASDHTLYAHYENVYSVNVNFKCGDATIYPATSVEASPTSLTPTITAPEIFGYTFKNWTGTNVTPADASSATTTITATAATTITANYDVVPTVYFKNNLGWDSVFVSFNCSFVEGKEYAPSNNGKPYYAMKQIGSTDIYYCEIPSTYTDGDYAGWAWNIAFDNTNYGKTAATTHTGTWSEFYGGECVGRGDFDPKATLYIPYKEDTESRNTCTFYKTGCWMKYNSTESGYQVKMNTWVTGEHADTLTVNLEAANAGGYEYSAKLNLTHANYSYGFKLYKPYKKNTTDLWYTNTGAIYATTDDLPWDFKSGSSINANSQRCELHTEALGDYTITVSFATGRPMVSVEYPTSVGDWRLAYNDRIAWSGDAHDASWYLYSRVIKAKANAEDLVSFYVSKADGANAHIELQKCTAIDAGSGAETWTKQGDNLNLSGITGTGIYNFKVTQNGSKVATAAYDTAYVGNYYIRTDAADGGWNNYISSGKNLMTYSEYAKDNSGFTHYFMRFINSGTNIKFCIANDYSSCLTEYCIDDDFTGEYIEADGNVRFMWDQRTNAVSRAYISGSTTVSDRFLVLEGDAKLFNENGIALTSAAGGQVAGLNEYEMNFGDDQNWIYEATVKAQPKAKVKLTAKYNNKIQYFYGDEGSTAADSVLLIDGTGTDKYKMRIVYDFKTNRLIKAFIPDGDIGTNLAIDADLMIIREHQGTAQQVTFSEGGALSKVKTVYGAMKFNKYTVNGKEKTGGHAGTGASRYERDLFYISFPFDVKLNEAFGFGTYGKHWILEYYDGKGRAANGFWADSDPNWKFVTPAQRNNGFVMKAFEGYILALDLDEMTESSEVWDNGVEDVYIYFPSTAEVEDIEATNRLIKIDQKGYECTINRNTPQGDRRVLDSYWHCIGVPSFANYNGTLYDIEDEETRTAIDWRSTSMPYLYTINWADKSLSITSSATFSFKATYSYMVQYADSTIYWSQVNATPSSVVARERTAPTNTEFRIELQKNGQKDDQTFVRLSDDENVTTGFDFNYDLSKEFNKNKANIYTMVTTIMEDGPSITQTAGNVLPMSDQTTVVPVGVKIASTGDYTFAIPEGTNGVGVTLIDNETGIRTSLSALDYTINLPAGTYDNRFVLEISPIVQSPTGIESTEHRTQNTDVHKVLIDNILYIVKDGVMYDARGARVQ